MQHVIDSYISNASLFRAVLAFDYAFNKLSDRLLTIENLTADQNLREMLPKVERHNSVGEVFNEEYRRHDSQRVEGSSQATCENNGSSTSNTASVFEILLEQYDMSLVLDYLTSEFYAENADHTQDAEFLFYADISDHFNAFGDSFEEYRDRSMQALLGDHLSQF